MDRLTSEQKALLERYRKAVTYCLPKFGNLVEVDGVLIEKLFLEDEPAKKAWYDIQGQISKNKESKNFMAELDAIQKELGGR